MAKKPKKDELSFIGVISAILRNAAQQRSLARTREKRRQRLEARRDPEQRAAEKKARKKAEKAQKAENRDTRTIEQIGSDVDGSRRRLVGTVSSLRYDLDVPARTRETRDRVASRIPRRFRGEPQAALASIGLALLGWGAIALGALRARR